MTQTFDLWQFLRDNTLSFVFTTIFLGAVVEVVRRGIEYVLTLPYRGWTLHVIPADSTRKNYEHTILLDEMRRIEASAFERRRFIQSVVTSEGGWLYAGQVETSDPKGWVYIDRKNKQYRFDMAKLPAKPEQNRKT